MSAGGVVIIFGWSTAQFNGMGDNDSAFFEEKQRTWGKSLFSDFDYFRWIDCYWYAALDATNCNQRWSGCQPGDALFTATSAACVTGLVVHNTASYWTLFGQLVILALIQVGGLVSTHIDPEEKLTTGTTLLVSGSAQVILKLFH
jgi:hypothetical protein